MMKQVLYFLMTILLAGLVAGCSARSKPDIYLFKGDIRTLLIQKSEAPPGWRLDNSSSDDPMTEEAIGRWAVVYASIPASNQLGALINHNLVAFKQEEFAVQSFGRGFYIHRPTVEPPQKYSYKSSIADEFKIACVPITRDVSGPVVGYEYYYLARYGNVVSELIAFVENGDSIEAGKTGLLPWTEVERLLKLIDEKFNQVGFGNGKKSS